MFNIGIVELVILFAAAVVVVGPQDLPKVARWIARVLRSIRNVINEFSSTMNIEEELKEVKEAGNLLKESVREINPVAEVTEELQKLKQATQADLKILTDLKSGLLDSSGGQDKNPISGSEKKET